MTEVEPLTRVLVALRDHLNLAADEINAIIKERMPPDVKEPTKGVESPQPLSKGSGGNARLRGKWRMDTRKAAQILGGRKFR